MAKCFTCKSKAVIVTEKPYCAEHFTNYFEKKVLATIKKFGLVTKKDKIMVGSSGGKDSTTVLYLLKKYYGNVEALAIDEGIPGYRNITLETLTKFCKSNKIQLHIYSYEKEFGFSLTEALKVRTDLKPCNICGTLRRYLLNTKSKGYTKMATGHNMDDEAQSIMMNIVKAQTQLLSRLGPMTGTLKDEGFVPRIKPLYFCTEKEVATYAIIKQFGIKFSQCPHAVKSFRAFIRDRLNEHETNHKGIKRNLIDNFLKLLPKLKKEQYPSLNHCSSCNEPASKELCKTCALVKSIAPLVSR